MLLAARHTYATLARSHINTLRVSVCAGLCVSPALVYYVQSLSTRTHKHIPMCLHTVTRKQTNFWLRARPMRELRETAVFFIGRLALLQRRVWERVLVCVDAASVCWLCPTARLMYCLMTLCRVISTANACWLRLTANGSIVFGWDYQSMCRPQFRWEYPLNLSISVSGGKETNKDSPSNCEWTGISPALNPAALRCWDMWCLGGQLWIVVSPKSTWM